jgi:hypothetical protein
MMLVKQIECFAQISNVLDTEAMFRLICFDPGRETIEAFCGDIENGSACCGPTAETSAGSSFFIPIWLCSAKTRL